MSVLEVVSSLIPLALKKGDKIGLEVLRGIKKALSDASKVGTLHTLTQEEENEVLKEMEKEYKKAIQKFETANRIDLVEKEKAELEILKEFLPKEPSEDEIEALTRTVIADYVKDKGDGYILSMRDMKPILTTVQATFPSANGGIVSKVLKENINK